MRMHMCVCVCVPLVMYVTLLLAQTSSRQLAFISNCFNTRILYKGSSLQLPNNWPFQMLTGSDNSNHAGRRALEQTATSNFSAFPSNKIQTGWLMRFMDI